MSRPWMEARNDPLGECKYHLRRGCCREDKEVQGIMIGGMCIGEGHCPNFKKRENLFKDVLMKNIPDDKVTVINGARMHGKTATPGFKNGGSKS